MGTPISNRIEDTRDAAGKKLRAFENNETQGAGNDAEWQDNDPKQPTDGSPALIQVHNDPTVAFRSDTRHDLATDSPATAAQVRKQPSTNADTMEQDEPLTLQEFAIW